MILDTSALVAILYREPEAATFAQAIHDADACRISVASYVELSMVIERQLGPEGMRQTERSEEHTSELQSLMRISYAVFCLKKKRNNTNLLTNDQTPKTTTHRIDT